MSLVKLRIRLAWWIMPDPLVVIAQQPDLSRETDYLGPHILKPKAPTPLWLNRRKALFQFGYDPRDTADP